MNTETERKEDGKQRKKGNKKPKEDGKGSVAFSVHG